MTLDTRISPADGGPHIRTVNSSPPTVVVDFGANPDVHADAVDETLIVVDEARDEQREYPLPARARRTFMRNGVLTIEVDE